MNIKYYWNNKQNRANMAIEHTKQMEKKYSNEIKQSINETKIYTSNIISFLSTDNIPEIEVVDIDSVGAIEKYSNGKTAILNFASFSNPGGGFIIGSRAQEECLCHESFLYNVLKEFNEYYEWNRQHKNNSMYQHRALYSPNIIFEHNNKQILCDVITCASPNISWALKTNDTRILKLNENVLKERIKMILDIAAKERVDTLILGAFGCGAFRQSPETVSKYFNYWLHFGIYGDFKKVIFAIPQSIDKTNYDVFIKNIR